MTEFYRYALPYRPPMPGAIPRDGLVCAVDMDEFCEAVNHHVYGYAIYSRKLSTDELRQYEIEMVEQC